MDVQKEGPLAFYVVFAPKRCNIAPEHFAAKLHEFATVQSKRGHVCTFAHQTFTNRPIREWSVEDRYRQIATEQLQRLRDGEFDGICFLGSVPRDFNRLMAYYALKFEVPIENCADKGSLLDRYLTTWFHANWSQALAA